MSATSIRFSPRRVSALFTPANVPFLLGDMASLLKKNCELCRFMLHVKEAPQTASQETPANNDWLNSLHCPEACTRPANNQAVTDGPPENW